MADLELTYNQVTQNVTVQEVTTPDIQVQVTLTGLVGPTGPTGPEGPIGTGADESFVIAMAIALG